MAKKILILGASGMLGHDLVQAFSDWDVVAWSSQDLDITNEAVVKEKILMLRPDVVVNAAAYTDVDGAEKNEQLAMQLNGEAPAFLAKACQLANAILVQFSTDSVFDGKKQTGYAEHDHPKPINVYGHSKLAGEALLQSYHNRYYIIRTSWLYGKAPQRGKPRGLNFVETMLKLAQDRPEINVVNDQFGRPTFTKDLSQRVRQLLDEQEHFGIYHLTNDGVCSWYEFAQEIFKIKGVDIKVNPIKSEDYPLPTPRPQYSILNNTKLKPMRSWQEALEDYLINNLN